MDEYIKDLNDIIYYVFNRIIQYKVWWGLFLNDFKEGYIGKNVLKKIFRCKIVIYYLCYGWFVCFLQKYDKYL